MAVIVQGLSSSQPLKEIIFNVVHLYMFNAGDDTVLVIGVIVGLGAVTMFCNISYLAGRPKQVSRRTEQAMSELLP